MPNPKNPQPTMSIETALEIVDDDLPDGAYFQMLSDLTGMDAGEVADALAPKASPPARKKRRR